MHRDSGPREPPGQQRCGHGPESTPREKGCGVERAEQGRGVPASGGLGSLSPLGLPLSSGLPTPATHPCTPPPLLSSHGMAQSLRAPIYGFSSLLIGICLPTRIKHAGFPVSILNQHISPFEPGLGEDKQEAAGSRPTGRPLRPPPLCSPSPLPGAQGEWSSHPSLMEDSGPRRRRQACLPLTASSVWARGRCSSLRNCSRV